MSPKYFLYVFLALIVDFAFLAGDAVGVTIGTSVGFTVDVAFGSSVGVVDGVTVGAILGLAIGVILELSVGTCIGVTVGFVVGTSFGGILDVTVGIAVGFSVGLVVGSVIGVSVGAVEAVLSISLTLSSYSKYRLPLLYPIRYLHFEMSSTIISLLKQYKYFSTVLYVIFNSVSLFVLQYNFSNSVLLLT